MTFKYRGKKFQQALQVIIAHKHDLPVEVISIGGYAHMSNGNVSVEYILTNDKGCYRGRSTEITIMQMMEFTLNYSL